jgi:hypothetical protein
MLKDLKENKKCPKEIDRLLKLNDVCENYYFDHNELYFIRNPVILSVVLDFYADSLEKHHVSNLKFCPLMLLKEFEYWKIDYETHMNDCCLTYFEKKKKSL